MKTSKNKCEFPLFNPSSSLEPHEQIECLLVFSKMFDDLQSNKITADFDVDIKYCDVSSYSHLKLVPFLKECGVWFLDQRPAFFITNSQNMLVVLSIVSFCRKNYSLLGDSRQSSIFEVAA